MRQIHVVAAVIRDALGRVLLARRTHGRDLAGLWEFSGGKLEPGETSDAALVRELREELGIEASVGSALIRVPQQYPDKRLLLDVYDVTYSGTPRGLDGQALVWVPPHKLVDYPMPPADRPVVAALLHADRYLVTPQPENEDPQAWLAQLQQALLGGIQRVQLRASDMLDATRWADLCERAVALCRNHAAEVLINGNPALARQLHAGLHLRADQLHAPEAAQWIAQQQVSGQPVAASCHHRDDLLRAEALGCDFAVLGPLAATASHPGAVGMGWQAFAELRESASLPIYAIGGMQIADIPLARQHGAQGIAAIRGLWPA